MGTEYHLKTFGVNSASIPGSYLAYNHLGLIERAFLAADLHLGAKRPTALTQRQSGMLARVNFTYVHWAVKRQAERAEIERGLIPLVPATLTHTNGNGNGAVPVVPDVGIDDAQLRHIAALVGSDRMLAAAI